MNREEQELGFNQQVRHDRDCPQYQQQSITPFYPMQQGQMTQGGQSPMWQPQAQMAPPQMQMQPLFQQQVQPQIQQQVPNPFAPQPPFANIPFVPTGNQSISDMPGMLPLEQSYIENILRLNRGKIAKVYMTFENNKEWNAKIFTGIIEAAGRDHIILSDPETGKRYLLLMVYLDYIEFNEELNYGYQPGLAQPGLLTTQPPR